MSSSLRAPQAIEDLLLFRLSRILATSGATVIRLCEGEWGITWREWRVPVPGDMRKATLSLTKKGQALFASFFPVVASLNTSLVQDLTDQELLTLDKMLTASQRQAENLFLLQDPPKANRRLGGRRARLQT